MVVDARPSPSGHQYLNPTIPLEFYTCYFLHLRAEISVPSTGLRYSRRASTRTNLFLALCISFTVWGVSIKSTHIRRLCAVVDCVGSLETKARYASRLFRLRKVGSYLTPPRTRGPQISSFASTTLKITVYNSTCDSPENTANGDATFYA